MKHLLLGLSFLVLLPITSIAQHWCGSDAERARLISLDPSLLDEEARFEEELRQIIINNATVRDEDLILTIPVVFHVLHLNGAENIPDSRLIEQIDRLNTDYVAANSDLNQVIAPFEDLIGDVKLQFALPTKDPYGNCHNGIDRIQTVQTLLGLSSSKANQWPRDRYLNVWVARDLENAGLLGYALTPASATGFNSIFDGIMIRTNTVGVADNYLGRTLTHEVGHYLSLAHPWGQTNEPGVACGDDGVEDTPITKGTFGCPSNPEDSKVCDPDIYENYQNHMDYSSCPRMFTLGQVERIRGLLDTETAQRNNLYTEANLVITGVAEGSQVSCAPVADFYAMVGSNPDLPIIPFSTTTCTGTNVKFVDNSSRATATEWAWTFQDGNPATSTVKNPMVQFTSPGFKSVTLTVTNAQGSSTKTNDYAVLVGSVDESYVGAYFEGFEGSSGIFPFIEANYDRNFSYWQRYTNGGFESNACARLNSGDRNPLDIINSTNDNDIDDLITPNLNLNGLSGAQLSFWYSYNTTTTDLTEVTERLEVYSSTDCGRSWQQRTSITGANLITSGTTEGPGPWTFRSISLPGSVITDNVRFRFRFVSSAFSGDLFIDNVNVGGPVGLDDLEGSQIFRVFPNPTNDVFNIQVLGMEDSATELIIQDLRGAVVHRNIFAPKGSMGIELSSRALGLAEGLYVLRISNASGSSAQKLIIGR